MIDVFVTEMSNSSSCVSCSVHFTLFKRKKRCLSCEQLYCSRCFKKGESLAHRNMRQCLLCHALSSNPYIHSELMLLPVKQLKAWLDERNVSLIGCMEKQDLVESIISYQASLSSSNHNESSSDEPQVFHDATSTEINEQASESSSQGMNDFFGGFNINAGIHVLQQFFQPNGFHQAHSSSNPTFSESNQYGASPATDSHDTTPFADQTPSEVQSKINVEKVKDESDIKNFSTRQLKVLLDDNYVDYRGCIEKDELVQRAMMLWHSKKQQQNRGSNDMNETEDRELCKVCMDRMIDCVFLECGHLVTCIQCGKQLRECPMCRQHITRIVRVFKS